MPQNFVLKTKLKVVFRGQSAFVVKVDPIVGVSAGDTGRWRGCQIFLGT
jgi:hypothetical protein